MLLLHPVRDALSVGMMLLFLFSCQGHHDPLVGRWTVDKVNVEFDESKSTPEMVRQFGEMEKGNVIEIGQDSILTFVSDGDTLRGRCSLEKTQLFLDGNPFGYLKDGKLITEEVTPLGKVIVKYRK